VIRQLKLFPYAPDYQCLPSARDRKASGAETVPIRRQPVTEIEIVLIAAIVLILLGATIIVFSACIVSGRYDEMHRK
jgi:hypothetical protein